MGFTAAIGFGLLAGGAVATNGYGLVGGGPDMPSSAPVQQAIASPPPVMPVVDDSSVKKARKRSLAAQMARRGRASTILTDMGDTDMGDKLGG